MKTTRSGGSTRIKVLIKTFEILEALHRSTREGARLSEVAVKVRLPRPTVFRILRTLESLGYVAFDSGLETYRITQRLTDLGQPYLAEVITRLARPAMMRLVAEFEQTVNLALFENGNLFYKDMLEGLRSVRMQPIPGTYLSIANSALGKCILAFFPRKRVREVLRGSANGAGRPRTASEWKGFFTSWRRLRRGLRLTMRSSSQAYAALGLLSSTATARPSRRSASPAARAFSPSARCPRLASASSGNAIALHSHLVGEDPRPGATSPGWSEVAGETFGDVFSCARAVCKGDVDDLLRIGRVTRESCVPNCVQKLARIGRETAFDENLNARKSLRRW